jgi:hypothetical protein
MAFQRNAKFEPPRRRASKRMLGIPMPTPRKARKRKLNHRGTEFTENSVHFHAIGAAYFHGQLS